MTVGPTVYVFGGMILFMLLLMVFFSTPVGKKVLKRLDEW
jgi:hypothetical protein